jgi:Tat protein secretion system quality control protein TatD with DNase activity
MAVMSVSSTDWCDVQRLARQHGASIIPAYGIHPWKAHLHVSQACKGTIEDALERERGPDSQEALPPEISCQLIEVHHQIARGWHTSSFSHTSGL